MNDLKQHLKSDNSDPKQKLQEKKNLDTKSKSESLLKLQEKKNVDLKTKSKIESDSDSSTEEMPDTEIARLKVL